MASKRNEKKRVTKGKYDERKAGNTSTDVELQESDEWERRSVATTIHVEEDFPRGGQEVITPLERRKIITQATHDDLFGKTSSLMEKDEEKIMLISNEGVDKKKKIEKKETVKVAKVQDHLYQKNLIEGLLILCAVREIQQYRLLMSLPFNMTGSVNIGNISDPLSAIINTKEEEEEEKEVPDLSKMYRVGQLLPCYVLHNDTNEKLVQLSINPKLINNQLTSKDLLPNMIVSGCISSIEDHGYIIDFGVPERTGFLLKKNAKSLMLCIGQVLSCLILPGPVARALPVSVLPDVVYSSVLASSPSLTLSSLLPGQLVSASVKQTTPTSLVLAFLGGFEGYVHHRHLISPDSSLSDYPVNKKLKTRILWTDTENKRMGLSLQPEIVKGTGYEFSETDIGAIFHEASIVRVEPKHGIVLKLPSSHFAYSPLRLMYSDRVDRVEKKHCEGSVHSVRVIQYNYIDGLVIVSLKESVLERQYFSVSDVKPGDVAEGDITKVTERGLCVRLGERFNGFCPFSQLSDSAHLKKLRKKLVVGVSVKCRVLKVDVEKGFVLLTRKKSLVSSSLPPLTDLAPVKPGEEYVGEIVNISDKGLTVRFYNGVTGFIPNVELSSTSSQVVFSPEKFFKVGQTLTTRVLSVDPLNNRLRLSLREQATPTGHAHPRVRPGEVLDCEVSGVASNGVSLLYNEELVFIPRNCLSDYTSHVDQLLAYHGKELSDKSDKGEKYVLKDVLILSEASSSSPPIGCVKRLIIDDMRKGDYPKSFDELIVGMVLAGVVRRSYSYGVFVEFPNGLVGLAPLKYLSDEYITSTSDVYQDRQTVLAKVHEVNDLRNNVTLSLRCSDLKLSLNHSTHVAQSILTNRFHNLLKERDLLYDTSSDAMLYKPGSLAKGQITSISSTLYHMTLETGSTATGYVSMATGGGVCPGDHVTCCVIDFDMKTGNYWVSLNSKLIKENEDMSGKGKKGKKTLDKINSYFKLEAGHSVTGYIEYVNNHYFMCSVSTLSRTLIAYGLFDSGQWGVIPHQLKHLKAGAKVDGIIIESSSLFNGKMAGPPVFFLGENNSMSQRGIVAKQLSVAIGDIVDAKIIAIRDSQLCVSFGPWKGRIHSTMLTDDVKEGLYPLTSYSVGDVVRARIINQRKRAGYSIKPRTVHFELSTRESLLNAEDVKNVKFSFSIGDKMIGVIREVNRSRLLIDITPTETVRVLPQFAGSNVTEDGNVIKLTKCFTPGLAVQCTIGDVIDKGQYYGTLTGSLPVINIGDTVSGSITGVQPNGLSLIISLRHYLSGVVHVTDITDYYVPRPLQYFNIGDKFSFQVIGKSPKEFYLSLRKSQTGLTIPALPVLPEGAEPDREINHVADLREGGVVRGYVSSVTKYGIFVKLGRDLVGRVMIRNLSDQFVSDYQSCVNVGDLVRTKILRIDSGQVELSLKLSDIDESASLKLKQLREMKRKGKKKRKVMLSESSEEEREEEEEEKDEEKEMSEGESEALEEEIDEVPKRKRKRDKDDEDGQNATSDTDMAPLPVSGGWDYNLTSDKHIENKEEENEVTASDNKKKTKRQKKAIKKAEELRLYQREHALLDISRLPESPDDFDRLIVANPNSSSLWLQYMAYYIHTAEVDKARSIAERGLGTISFREEGEKLNLWIGLLNLENMYGDGESLNKVFNRALQQNDPLTVYNKMIDIYVTSNKNNLADQLYQVMCKKFRDDAQVWTKYVHFLMEQGRAESARRVLQRSLKSLTKKQHVDIIKQFAQFEFKYGEMERGCTLFENLVSSYPRKVDIWSIYIDMLIKKKEIDRTRDVFERAVSLKLSSVKRQFLFKRYIEFERRHGSQSLMETVQAKAQQLL